MNNFTDKITDFCIKHNNLIYSVIILILVAIFLISTHSRKSTTVFKCSNSNCTIQKLDNKGTVKSFRTIPANFCKSFYVAEKLSLPETIFSYFFVLTNSDRKSHFGREEAKTVLYTVGCIYNNGNKLPLFDTYIHDYSRTQSNVDTLNNIYINTKSPTFEMNFDEKETVFK